MATQPTANPLPLARLIFVGMIVPTGVTLVDHLLQVAVSGQSNGEAATLLVLTFMLVLVAQVSLLGVLCGRLVEPGWLRWVLYGWCLSLTDLNLFAAGPELSGPLLASQIGLVLVWVIVGSTLWKTRWAVGLLIAGLVFWDAIRLNSWDAPSVQIATLCLICFVLRSQQFRLALLPSTIPAAIYAVDGTGQSSRGKGVQFGIRDVLIWTTSLALILAAARSRDWYMLSQGLLSAMVIVAALWAALGEGPAWLRWPLLVVFTFSAGLAQSVVDWSYLRMWPAKPGFWSLEHWDYLWLNQWWLLVAACFAGSLLAAALLIYRVLGYRLCRVVKQANQDDSMRSTA